MILFVDPGILAFTSLHEDAPRPIPFDMSIMIAALTLNPSKLKQMTLIILALEVVLWLVVRMAPFVVVVWLLDLDRGDDNRGEDEESLSF